LKRAEADLLEFERVSNERAVAPPEDAHANQTEPPSAQPTLATVDAHRDEPSPPRELHAHDDEALADESENVVAGASAVDREFNFASPPPRARTRTRGGQSPAAAPFEHREKRARTTPSRFAR